MILSLLTASSFFSSYLSQPVLWPPGASISSFAKSSPPSLSLSSLSSPPSLSLSSQSSPTSLSLPPLPTPALPSLVLQSQPLPPHQVLPVPVFRSLLNIPILVGGSPPAGPLCGVPGPVQTLHHLPGPSLLHPVSLSVYSVSTLPGTSGRTLYTLEKLS